MKKNAFVVTCKLPWWFKGYVFLLAGFCYTFRTEPDPEKIYKFVQKHIKFKFECQEVKE